jgi:hypothetical protein
MDNIRRIALALAFTAGLATAAHAALTVKLVNVAVAGTDLRVALSDGRTLSGNGLVGTVLGLRNEAGAAVRVKVEAVLGACPNNRRILLAREGRVRFCRWDKQEIPRLED